MNKAIAALIILLCCKFALLQTVFPTGAYLTLNNFINKNPALPFVFYQFKFHSDKTAMGTLVPIK